MHKSLRRLQGVFSPLCKLQPLYFCSLFILLFAAAVPTVCSILLLLHIPINFWIVPFSFLLSCALYFFFVERGMTAQKKKGLLLFLLVFSVLLLFSSLLYELTWDGNSYHKQAVGALANGWNPIYESLDTHLEQVGLAGSIKSYAIWNDHYAKGAWFFGAAVYRFTGNIECGKCLLPLLMLALFGLLYSYLRQKAALTKRQSLLIALLTAVNPITLPQLFNYYNDGLLLCTLFCEIVCFLRLADIKETRPKAGLGVGLVCAIILCVNIKFTGLVYAGVFALLFCCLLLLQSKRRFRTAAKLCAVFACVFLFAVLIVGSSGYVRNTLDHANPFYPLAGEDAADIMTHNQPESFENASPAEKLLRVIFAKSESVQRKEPEWKLPFLLYPSELRTAAVPDARFGGFGPLFSGLLCIALPLLLFAFVALWRRDRFRFCLLAGNFLLIFTLLFTISDSWWARYSPYFYLIVLAALVFLCVQKNKQPGKFPGRLLKFYCVLLLANTLFFLPAQVKNVGGSVIVWLQGIQLKQEYRLQGKPLPVYFNPKYNYSGILYNLDDLGIAYTISTQEPENAQQYYMIYVSYPSVRELGTIAKLVDRFAPIDK